MEVKFITGHRRGMHKRVVTIISDDPETPKLDVLIIANIQVEFAFWNPYLKVGGLYEDETVTKRVFLQVRNKEDGVGTGGWPPTHAGWG